jgi:hypothetical protein
LHNVKYIAVQIVLRTFSRDIDLTDRDEEGYCKCIVIYCSDLQKPAVLPKQGAAMENHTEKTDSIYDQLQGVYQHDPEEFERLSGALIRQALDDVPEELRAQAYGIQRRIEHQLNKYKDPIARMNAMVEIFWQQFHEFQAVINDPCEVLENRRHCGTKAKILPFKGPDPGH